MSDIGSALSGITSGIGDAMSGVGSALGGMMGGGGSSMGDVMGNVMSSMFGGSSPSTQAAQVSQAFDPTGSQGAQQAINPPASQAPQNQGAEGGTQSGGTPQNAPPGQLPGPGQKWTAPTTDELRDLLKQSIAKGANPYTPGGSQTAPTNQEPPWANATGPWSETPLPNPRTGASPNGASARRPYQR
jgi:hypothetical protein